MTVKNVKDNNLNQIINEVNTKLVVVDFWALWCGPCRILAPIFEELATKYEGTVSFVKCNVDDNQQTAQKYGVQSIPTIVFIKNGQPVKKIVGVQPISVFEDMINRLI